MLSALVLINCYFPFEKNILEKLETLSGITEIYRTQGIYDLIVKIESSSEQEYKKTLNDMGSIHRVNSVVSLIIKQKKESIA